ncbi:MAG: glycosyltransferase family 4 protein, partial [Bacteroidetes bacterium]|nr:glycosyltransferase family 4 protein [Bacteroidota bacterium]
MSLRLVFVSHSFSPPDKPLTNVGGMQRVAMELDAAVRRVEADEGSLEYDALFLEASWKWVHVLAVPFLLRTWITLRRRIRRGEVDIILFSSMVTAALAVPLKKQLRKHGVKAAAIVHG